MEASSLFPVKSPPRLFIRDLAAEIGVSHAAVPLALRGSPRITPSVRKQVRRAARQAGGSPGRTGFR